MTVPLLATKLYIPTNRPTLVSRPHLIEKLNEGLYRKLTLISAPAGVGKTTLVSEWLNCFRGYAQKDAQIEIRVAWLSLDEGDDDLVRFLSYLIAALKRAEGIASSLGDRALAMLQSSQLPPVQIILTSLINEIDEIPFKIILVLDDFHAIESQPILEALSYLLEHLPPQLHLVVATRVDPRLYLARIRARDQLTELRAIDMRFNSSEISEFLSRVMGLKLSDDDIATLETQTEGWVVGLQLAAISLQGKEDTAGLIRSFSGSHRLVLDYLIEEVLGQQPPDIQTFLLRTAILNQFTESLCNTLTGDNNGRTALEYLERANLFVIPLDEERYWYRYHHLFGDLLRKRLKQTQPDLPVILHQRASEWYEQNELIDEALDHALRAEDIERAVYLIEQHVDTIWAQGEYAKLRRWLIRLPDELVLSRPQLSIFQAWELFASGRPDAGERFLRTAELARDLSAEESAETESQSQDQPPIPSELEVQGRAAAIQAWMAAYRRHNIPGLIQHLRQALEKIPDHDVHWRGAVAITLADSYAFSGDMPAAYQARLEASKACEAAGNTYLFLYNSAKLALNLKAQGQLQQVQELCQQRVRFANEIGMSQISVVGWILAIWGDVLAEINDLDGALDLVERSIELTECGGDVVMHGWSNLYLTRVLFSKGDMVGAEKIVQKMNRVARESIVPTWILNHNAVWQSRIWLAQDKVEVASQWASERELDINKKPYYLDGLEYIGLARVLIAQGKLHESTLILEHLLKAAHTGRDITREIELLMLQALAFQSGGDLNQALTVFEKALDLGQPRGFYRIFVDEGPPMAHLLYNALDRGIAPEYVSRLLQAFPIDKPEQSDSRETQSLQPDAIEPLSKREIEVLQLIAEGFTNQEIASRLILSLHTVKTHARNIYGKLGVHNRTAAITRAKVLGILSPT